MRTPTRLSMAVIFCASIFGPSLNAQVDQEMLFKIQKGFQLAPVNLNLTGRDSNIVGYGSYLVNFVGECNGCHSAGPATEFTVNSNPYFRQATRTNPATYLGGGRDFGAFPDPAGNFPHIISRNLTPDSTGMSAGNTLAQFMAIMRTGLDPDNLHPTCTGKPDGTCLPPPFAGALLQIMPWPAFGNMTDYDLTAIYTYMSSIPCLEDTPPAKTKRCGTAPVSTVKTTAVAGPKNALVISRYFQLDGSQSTSFDGKPLTYSWTIPAGAPAAGILYGNTAMPTVQLGPSRGIYTFQLTVTDSAGNTATDTVSLTYQGV